jgi:hypothetical protein
VATFMGYAGVASATSMFPIRIRRPIPTRPIQSPVSLRPPKAEPTHSTARLSRLAKLVPSQPPRRWPTAATMAAARFWPRTACITPSEIPITEPARRCS